MVSEDELMESGDEEDEVQVRKGARIQGATSWVFDGVA